MKKLTTLPKWFKGTIYDKGDTVTNPFSGEEYKLTNLELSMYDFIMGAQMIFALNHEKQQKPNEKLIKEFNKGLEWFKENNLEAYEILIEGSSSSQPIIKDKTDLKEIKKIKKIKLIGYYSEEREWDSSNKSRDSEQLSKYRNFKFECEGKTIILGTHLFQQGDNFHNDDGSFNFYFLNKMNVFYNINYDEQWYKDENEIKEVDYNFFNANNHNDLEDNLREYVWGTDEDEWEEDGLNNDEFYYEL